MSRLAKLVTMMTFEMMMPLETFKALVMPIRRMLTFVTVTTFATIKTLLMLLTFSVTRFGEISPLWQRFTSNRQFFDRLPVIWQICDIIGLICIAANGRILKNNLVTLATLESTMLALSSDLLISVPTAMIYMTTT